MLSNSLIELDQAHLVHPVASDRGHESAGVRVLKSAKGATVTDASGHQLVDGFAGLWCVNASYGHETSLRLPAGKCRSFPTQQATSASARNRRSGLRQSWRSEFPVT
jgi:putrescine aminotransferase